MYIDNQSTELLSNNRSVVSLKSNGVRVTNTRRHFSEPKQLMNEPHGLEDLGNMDVV